jgi:hypothetical protein
MNGDKETVDGRAKNVMSAFDMVRDLDLGETTPKSDANAEAVEGDETDQESAAEEAPAPAEETGSE